MQPHYGEYSKYLEKLEKGQIIEDDLYFTINPNHIFKGSKLFTGQARGIIRLTMYQYEELINTDSVNKEAIYFVTDNKDGLKFIYAGDVLIAKSDSTGTFAFPYSFPIIFGSN